MDAGNNDSDSENQENQNQGDQQNPQSQQNIIISQDSQNLINIPPSSNNPLVMGPNGNAKLTKIRDNVLLHQTNSIPSAGTQIRKKNFENLISDIAGINDTYSKSKVKMARTKIQKMSNAVSALVNACTEGSASDINAIKEIVESAGASGIKLEKLTNVVNAIINSRKDGQYIWFNENIFKRNLHKYVVGKPVKAKCLTNDYLNLLANCALILQSQGVNPQKELNKCYLKSVKVVSDNFVSSSKAFKGYIQDYDPHFSAICSQRYPRAEADAIISSMSENPQSYKLFNYNEVQYKYFGTTDFAVVAPVNSTANTIMTQFDRMKYFYSDKTGFTAGEKEVPFNNDLCYIDVKLTPDDFCPAYWASELPIDVKFFFDFEEDYNNLFATISQSAHNDRISLPQNLFYWDTITQGFDFLAVLAITGITLSMNTRKELAEWVDTYNTLKPYIKKWKINQLLLQRILMDFTNAISYKSEFIRYVHIYQKVQKYIEVYNILTGEKELYTEMVNFFRKLPCCQMINNQFNSNYANFAFSLDTTLYHLIAGSKADGVADELKVLYNNISTLLPGNNSSDVAGMEKALFPFIIAPAGIMGQGVKIDALALQTRDLLATRAQMQDKKKKKKKDKSINFATSLNDITDYITDYWKAYIKERGVELQDGFNLKRDVISPFFMLMDAEDDAAQAIAEIAHDYQEMKKKAKKKLAQEDGGEYEFQLVNKNRDAILQSFLDYYINLYDKRNEVPVGIRAYNPILDLSSNQNLPIVPIVQKQPQSANLNLSSSGSQQDDSSSNQQQPRQIGIFGPLGVRTRTQTRAEDFDKLVKAVGEMYSKKKRRRAKNESSNEN